MIGVVIHIEDCWNYTQSDRDIDILQIYQETAKFLGADLFVIVDKTTEGVFSTSRRPDLEYATYNSIGEVISAYPDMAKLYFEHIRTIPLDVKYVSLSDLIHPKDNVLYVFGGDDQGLNFAEIPLGENDQAVTILVPDAILWVIVAMTIVFTDRNTKGTL